jgi:hypothetical protein
LADSFLGNCWDSANHEGEIVVWCDLTTIELLVTIEAEGSDGRGGCGMMFSASREVVLEKVALNIRIAFSASTYPITDEIYVCVDVEFTTLIGGGSAAFSSLTASLIALIIEVENFVKSQSAPWERSSSIVYPRTSVDVAYFLYRKYLHEELKL